MGRDIQTLVQLLPGVTQSVGPSGSVFGFDSQFGGFPDPTHIVGSGISVNGSQGGANAWYLDGTLNAILGPESVVVNPSPDAVGEFAMSTTVWQRNGAERAEPCQRGAEIGHQPVPRECVRVQSQFVFQRQQSLSAPRRERQSNSCRHAYNFNDFGGTIGGPIRKNKTFFFASWETSFLHESLAADLHRSNGAGTQWRLHRSSRSGGGV